MRNRNRWIAMLVILVSVTVAVGILRWATRPRAPMGDPVLEQLRVQLLTAADNLVAIEVQRFVPPGPIVAPDGTVSGQRVLDRYSMDLEHLSQQIMWEVRIGISVVIADLRSLDGEAYAKAKARAVVACVHLLQLLDQVNVAEDNERTYVQEMRTTVDAIVARLTGRIHLRVR